MNCHEGAGVCNFSGLFCRYLFFFLFEYINDGNGSLIDVWQNFPASDNGARIGREMGNLVGDKKKKSFIVFAIYAYLEGTLTTTLSYVSCMGLPSSLMESLFVVLVQMFCKYWYISLTT